MVIILEIPRLYIRDVNDKTIAALDRGDYFNDTLTRFLAGKASVLEFTILKKEGDYELFSAGKKISFKYEDEEFWLNMMISDQDEKELTVTALSLNLEMNNEATGPYAGKSLSFERYFKDMVNYENSVTIGINEVSEKRISNEWTGTDTNLSRLFSLATVFGAELEFVSELNPNGSLKRIVMNVYKEHSDTVQGLGIDRRNETFRFGKDIKTVRKTEDASGVYTAIRPYGKDGLSIASIEKEILDGNGKILFATYKTPKLGFMDPGKIYAPQSRDVFPSTLSNEDDRWIVKDTEEMGYKSAEALFGYALGELKKNCVPKTEWEIEGYIKGRIGDTIRVADSGYKPEIYLDARITEQTISFTKPSQNKSTFSNVKELQSQVSTDLLKEMEKIIEANKVYTCTISSTNGVTFKNGEGSTVLTAIVRDSAVEVTDKFSIEWFKDGIFLDTGAEITVNASDVDGKSVYKFVAKKADETVAGIYEVTVTDVSDGKDGGKGEQGVPGENGKEVISGYLSNESLVLPANASGTVSDFSKATGKFVVYEGQTQKTSGVTYAVTSQIGLTATIDASGTYKVTALSADSGTAIFKATYGGVSIEKILIATKAKQGGTGEKGNDGTNGINASGQLVFNNAWKNYPYSTDKPTNLKETGWAYHPNVTILEGESDFPQQGIAQFDTHTSGAWQFWTTGMPVVGGTYVRFKGQIRSNEPIDQTLSTAYACSRFFTADTPDATNSSAASNINGKTTSYYFRCNGKSTQNAGVILISETTPAITEADKWYDFEVIQEVPEGASWMKVSCYGEYTSDTQQYSYRNYTVVAYQKGDDGLPAYVHNVWSNSENGELDFTVNYPKINLFSASLAQPYNASSTESWTNTGIGSVSYSRKATANGGIYVDDKSLFKPNTSYFGRLVVKEISATKVIKTVLLYSPFTGLLNEALYLDGAVITGGVAGSGAVPCDISDGKEHILEWSFSTGAEWGERSYTGHILQFEKENAVAYSIEISKLKFEENTFASIYTPPPTDDPIGAYMKYMGTCSNHSETAPTEPSEYHWEVDPTYLEYSKVGGDQYDSDQSEIYEVIGGKADSEEFQALKREADALLESYNSFVSEGGKYEQDLENIENRAIGLIEQLNDKIAQFEFIKTYIRMGEEGLEIGAQDSTMKMLLTKDSLSFMDGGKVVAYFTQQSFYINRGAIVESLQIGNHKFTKLNEQVTVVQYVG